MNDSIRGAVTKAAKDFSSQSHGASDLDKAEIYVMGENENEYVPFSILQKESPDVFTSTRILKSIGYVYSSFSFIELVGFEKWFQNQFNKRLSTKAIKSIGILHYPNQKSIFETVEVVHQTYQILKDHKVLVNGKNLPIQLGEWYSKIIFGLHQHKSSSQRGFDFSFDDGKLVEVIIHWQDSTSPKGVKVKKSLADLADYCIVMYIAKNFMIRDILFVDTDFIVRKFGAKGHTIFLKDNDVSQYFFSRSDKHLDKVVNKTALLQFSSPNLAMRLEDRFS